MAQKYFSMRNLKFLMNEVFEVSQITQHSYYAHLDKESIEMILETAQQIGDNIIEPIAIEMDRKQAEFENGKIIVHPKVKDYIQAMGESGMIGATASMENGGSQLPESVTTACGFILGAANNGIVSYTGLTNGSAGLIVSFGSQALKDMYIPKMFSGAWQGTMCLTEPQAGSSLHYITSTASPTDIEGKFKIKGQKIYITAGDHDQTENVVHLYLARIDGAPAGTKGISLFVVPKFRPENGSLVDNDMKTIGIYHKMGQKGSPAVHLQAGADDNCEGWLVGEAHQGLKYMFKMMNEARVGVGTTGVAIASSGYYAALQYARERPQGQALSEKGDDPNTPQTLIINHPDVKRMLLFQKSIVEGSLALILQGTKYADLIHTSEGETKEKYQILLDFLTPVIKTFPTEFGTQSVNSSLQVFGGGGFCEDFPLERLYRDIRITTIYEGTTGIQSLALLGRNVVMKNGKAAILFFQEVMKDIQQAKEIEGLTKYADILSERLQMIQKVTQHLLPFALKGDKERFLADATLYMEMFGIVCVAWQWLNQGVVAQKALENNPTGDDKLFYQSKLHTLKYYFAYEVPKTQGLATRLLDAEVLTTSEMANEWLM
jgi:alkylation response protein AidB-like acyl-CoA dehydrogenase